jgi:hypothetical protein
MLATLIFEAFHCFVCGGEECETVAGFEFITKAAVFFDDFDEAREVVLITKTVH